MDMPERIVTLETAVGRLYVAAFLYCRLALSDEHVVDMQVVRSEQWAFASELFVFYDLHDVVCRFYLFDSVLLYLCSCPLQSYTLFP